jgi:hypothetical protein
LVKIIFCKKANPCGANQIYELRSECPKSCLYLQGLPDCGLKKPIEGCYCKTGYVYDAQGNCVLSSACGCLLPDGTGIINVGQKVTNLDCTVAYSCTAVGKQATVEPLSLGCGPNAICTVANNQPACQCISGFYGDGFSCSNIQPPIVLSKLTLMNHWPMNNLNDIVSNANLFDGTGYSFVPDRFGVANSTIYFNKGFLKVPEGIYFNGDFTITAWINVKSLGTYFRILDFGNGQYNDNVLLGFFENSARIYGEILIGQATVGSRVIAPTTSVINLNEWYHVAFTVIGTQGTLYINGIKAIDAAVKAPSNIIRKSNFIGKSNWPDQNANAIYDDIKIYKGGMSADKVLEDYNNGKAITSSYTKRYFDSLFDILIF